MQFHTLLTLALAATATALPATIVRRAEDLSPSGYDYVVVGGGTSGLIVAARLSENPKVSVLVLESGPLPEGEEHKTLLVPFNSNAFRYSWNLTSSAISGLQNRTSIVFAARVMGGGTAVNGMFIDRGSPADYDEWATLTGDPGWGFKSLLNYFKKAETFTPPSKEWVEEMGITWDPAAHGFKGPLQLGYPPVMGKGFKLWHNALKAFGVPAPRDGGNNAIGTFYSPNSIDPVTRQRSYSRNEYHDPATKRKNYHFIPNRTVTKIIFDKARRAVGVEFAEGPDAERTTVKVKREVVVAAGAAGSPKVLQLSGVGDKRLLDKVGVKTVVDLPGVGENFQDHAAAGAQYRLKNIDPNAGLIYTNATYAAEQLALFWANGTGAYTQSTGGNHASFLPFPLISNRTAPLLSAAAADKNLYLPPHTHPTVAHGFRKQKSVLLRDFATHRAAITEGVQTSMSVQKPLSRGWVHITSPDPFEPVELNFNTLSHPFDLTVLVEGIRWLRGLMQSPGLAVLEPVEQGPGPEVAGDDEALGEWIRGVAGATMAHIAGSCKMGFREEGAVVDSRLRVYGVKGVRVVDASVMPVIPATHLTNTVYAVAERAADLIKLGGN